MRWQSIGRWPGKTRNRGPLKLTAPYDFANRVIVPALPALRDRYPCIDLELLTTTGLVDLATREADIAVRLTAKPPECLVGRKILPLRRGIYGAPGYIETMREVRDVIVFRSEVTVPEWVSQYYPKAKVVCELTT